MKLLEYEAKQVLRDYGLATPAGRVLREDETAAGAGSLPVVVKAQVPVGGRGLAGGVRVVHTEAEFAAARDGLLGKDLLGHRVHSVLAEELLEPVRELYMAVALDRTRGSLVLLAHHSGGMEINRAVSERGAVLRLTLHGRPAGAVARRAREYLALPEMATDELLRIIQNLWTVCVREDAALVEVNPLMVMADGHMICADAKIELDDAAAFRHPDRGFESQAASAQFVVLSSEGTVASLANGAGLAMATNDAIAAAGLEPANFFDVGGGTNADDMTRGFDKIRALGNVQAVVVNIFGGITRCDEVAEAILAARSADAATPPLFVRLAGTNAAEGEAMLRAEGIELLPSLAACVEQAAAQVRRV